MIVDSRGIIYGNKKGGALSIKAKYGGWKLRKRVIQIEEQIEEE